MAERDAPRHGTISLRHDGDQAWVQFSGEIDVVTVAQLTDDDITTNAEGAEVYVDLSAVTFIDSSGLRLLVTVRDRARAVHLIDTPPLVARLLRVTGMNELFD